MSFLVLAFPELSPTDSAWLSSYKGANDEVFGAIEPHFTLVFAVDNLDSISLIEEIRNQTTDVRSIEFILNDLMIVKDHFSEYYHEFLVPEKGFEEINSLHDKLYSNKLLSNLRHDIEFLPHITIGSSKDPCILSSRIENLRPISISGKINSLTVVSYTDNAISKLADIRLKD